MPRGGARPGSGPKPKRRRNVVDFPAGSSSSASSIAAGEAAARESLLEPPADLRDGRPAPGVDAGLLPSEKDFWRRYAPSAIEQGTLVPATVHGFRELCELAAFKEEYAARLAKYGSDGKTGADRMRMYTRLAQRLDVALARFKLTAFGKAADGGGAAAGKPSANRFAQL